MERERGGKHYSDKGLSSSLNNTERNPMFLQFLCSISIGDYLDEGVYQSWCAVSRTEVENNCEHTCQIEEMSLNQEGKINRKPWPAMKLQKHDRV